jgi:hypothetical protein
VAVSTVALGWVKGRAELGPEPEPVLPIFSMAVLTLQEPLINKGSSSVCLFLLLNNVSGAKGSEISQMLCVKYWYYAINYFECIRDFSFDLLQ